VRDVNFSFKLVKQEVLKKARLRSLGSFIDAELLIEARKYGFRIKEIGIRYYPRTEANPRWPLQGHSEDLGRAMDLLPTLLPDHSGNV